MSHVIKQLHESITQWWAHRKMRQAISTGVLGQMLEQPREQGLRVMECGHTSEAHAVADALMTFAQAQDIPIQAFVAGCHCLADQTHWSPVLRVAMAHYNHQQPAFMAPAPQAWQ